MTLSQRLKIAREKAGLSQPQFANMLEIPVRTYRSYEHGERDVNTALLLKICKVLNVSSDYLLGRDNSSDNQLSNSTMPDEQDRLDEDSSKEELDETLVILNRDAKKLSPENRKKLLEMAKIMFKETFDE